MEVIFLILYAFNHSIPVILLQTHQLLTPVAHIAITLVFLGARVAVFKGPMRAEDWLNQKSKQNYDHFIFKIP